MKNYLLLFLFCMIGFGQSYEFQILDNNGQIIHSFKDKHRIKVKLKDHTKIIGNWGYVNDSHILIGDKTVLIDEIIKIKRQPIGYSVLTSTVFIYSGAIIIGAGSLIGLANKSAVLPTFLIGGTFLTIGILSPNVLKGYIVQGEHSAQLFQIESK
jgi:hypothetical protein